jgi:hypothetical protein
MADIDVNTAIAQYKKIKEALVGPVPEWCLPRVNVKAKASDPKLDKLPTIMGCKESKEADGDDEDELVEGTT